MPKDCISFNLEVDKTVRDGSRLSVQKAGKLGAPSTCGTTSLDDEPNKAGYTAQDAPSTHLKITLEGRTYGPTDRRTDGRTHPLIEMRRRI